MIELTGINFKYKNTISNILSNIDLEIKKGEFSENIVDIL